MCAVADYQNTVVDVRRAFRTGIYATRIHLMLMQSTKKASKHIVTIYPVRSFQEKYRSLCAQTEHNGSMPTIALRTHDTLSSLSCHTRMSVVCGMKVFDVL